MQLNNPLIEPNFLLESKYAEVLYHEFASKMPIIDYHNHLSPEQIAKDSQYKNITELWIDGDHYKWRAMRALGIDEKYITGNAPPKEKFQKWAHTVPYTMRNPLYHWTHLELHRYFGITDVLTPKNADAIFEATTEKLQTSAFSCRKLLSHMNVEVLCTTDDPTDTLGYHQELAKSDFKTRVGAAFRPDKALFIQNEGYNQYVDRLQVAADLTITTYVDLCSALKKRMDYFHKHGCSISDHGLEYVPAVEFTENEVKAIFKKRREKGTVTEQESLKFQSALLLFLSEAYHELGWVQQFHLGALRNNNSRMFNTLGADTGWDSIGDWSQAKNLSKFLDRLDSKDKLTKTIIYNLNPSDNEVLAAMIGNFNDGSEKGKIQFGSGWWFLDQKDGMMKQMNALSNIGLISCFIGMLTDSRSFLSFPRHEYFRRILCNLFGDEIKRGELPNDIEWIGKLIQDISYNNAKAYFDF